MASGGFISEAESHLKEEKKDENGEAREKLIRPRTARVA